MDKSPLKSNQLLGAYGETKKIQTQKKTSAHSSEFSDQLRQLQDEISKMQLSQDSHDSSMPSHHDNEVDLKGSMNMDSSMDNLQKR